MPSNATIRTDEALQSARAALQGKNPREAEWISAGVLNTEPRNAQAVRILGYALLMQGRADDAIAKLEPAVRSFNDPEIDTQLGLALRQAGRNEDANMRFLRATKRRPPFAPAFYEHGALLFAMKRYDAAVEVLERGLKVDPAMPELSNQLGLVLIALRNYEDAKHTFSKTLAIAPNMPEALWGMGKAHQASGEHHTAIEYFRRCLLLVPNDVGTLLNLGYSLLEINDLDAGYECFRVAARGNSKCYSSALTTMVKSRRGRFWLNPSMAQKFLRGENSIKSTR